MSGLLPCPGCGADPPRVYDSRACDYCAYQHRINVLSFELEMCRDSLREASVAERERNLLRYELRQAREALDHQRKRNRELRVELRCRQEGDER